MQGVLSAPVAKFIELQPVRIVATILLRSVITLLAFNTLEVNHHANVFLSHVSLLNATIGQIKFPVFSFRWVRACPDP
jgi:hypothetical protein